MSHNARRKQRERNELRALHRATVKPVLLFSTTETGEPYLVAVIGGPEAAKWRDKGRMVEVPEEHRRAIGAKFWEQLGGRQ